jgi:hypothetical protein
MNFKTLFTIAIFNALFFTVTTTAKDLTNDSCINIADTKKFLELIASGQPVDASLDLNKDSKVDLSDALLYGQWVNGLYHSATCPDLFLNNPADTAAFSRYAKDVITQKKTLTAAALSSQYPYSGSVAALNYTSSNVNNTADIASGLRKMLPDGDQYITPFIDSVLSKGVGIFDLKTYPNFLTALDAIHSADMPMIFTTDALLYSIYKSYDNILMTLETNRIIAKLEKILTSSLNYCNNNYGTSGYETDVKEYLSTALLLLNPNRTDIEISSNVSSNLKNIQSEAMVYAPIFGRNLLIDFSQFKPRGHYITSTALKNYFKAMMWLSRADLSIPISDTTSLPRMKKAALVLWDCVVNSGSYSQWLEINSIIEFMVGTSDGLSLKGVGPLVQDLGISDIKKFIATFNESAFDSVVSRNNYGVQMILSQGIYYDSAQDSLNLPKIVSFMPQRFILDSYTFSQLVYPLTTTYREMPTSRDIAFVLGDNSAIVKYPDLSIGGMPGILSCQRKLYDQISHTGYMANLYTSWIYSLRQLNDAERNEKISPVFRTDAWRMKMRNTQLMSWAHLRHNTLLYAKQSYTGMATCSYPRAYIEPYPSFFKAIADYAAKGKQFFTTYDKSVADYFGYLEATSRKLKECADYAASGKPLLSSLEIWLKNCITSSTQSAGCTTVKVFNGWYMDLFYAANSVSEGSTFFPSVADVHTKPADVMGPAKVLHAATGYVNLMAVIVEADSCPMIFVGPVGSYYDVTTEDPASPQRLTDQEWSTKISAAKRPSWMDRIVFKTSK